MKRLNDLLGGMSRRTLYVLVAAGILLVAMIVSVVIYRRSVDRNSYQMMAGINFQPYISAYTSGIVSKESAIRVVFTQDLVGSDEVGREAQGSLLLFSPKIKGELIWVNARTLEFVPAEPLRSDQAYSALVPLHKLFDDVPKEAKEFVFSFRTIRQQADFSEIYYFAQAEGSSIEGCVRGIVSMADFVRLETLREALVVEQGGKVLQVQLQEGTGNREFQFTTGEVDPRGGEITYYVKGKPLGIDDSPVRTLELPEQGGFFPYNWLQTDGETQFIRLFFNKPLDANQYLHGLVHAEGVYDIRCRVEGNILTITPGNRLDGQYIFELEAAIRTAHRETLNEGYTVTATFTGGKPEVEFLQSGSILPATGQVHIPFRAKGLKGVDVFVYQIFESNMAQYFQTSSYSYASELKRVGRLVTRRTVMLDALPNQGGQGEVYALDLSKIIQIEPGAIYRVGLSMRRELATYVCDELSGDLPVQDIADIPLPQMNWDGGYDFYGDYDYDWSERNNPCHPFYYVYRGTVWNNILVSNIGLIAKRGAGRAMRVFTTSITESKPIASVKLTLLDYQLQELASGTSDSEGMCTLEAVNEGEPFLIIARLGEQSSYLPVQEQDALSFSTFDVSGVRQQKGLQGFIYGERDVWRPGDSIFMALIVEDKLKTLPEGHPVEFTLYNPSGQLVDRQVVAGNPLNMYSYITRTSSDAPTGNYRLVATVGEARFRKSVRVETVKPNRLKIDLDFQRTVLESGESTPFTLRSSWLHGAPARNLKADIMVRLSKRRTQFDGYDSYEFTDLGSEFNSYETGFFEGYLDADGVVHAQQQIARPGKAPGMLSATFNARVHEAGGGFSVHAVTLPFSPYSSYVGVCAPESDRYFLETDRKQEFSGVVLDKNGKPMSNVSVAVAVYKLAWSWWWEHDNTSFSSYLDSKAVTLVEDLGVMTTNSRGEIKFDVQVNYPDWGRYVVRLANRESGHAASKVVYWDWPSDRERTADRNGSGSTVLAFTSDKSKYEVGDRAKISVPTPAGGSLLVSVESANTVLDAMWIEAKEGQTEVTIPVTGEMAPNVYVNITLLQPYGQTANDLPLRMYGVIPLMVENRETHLIPEIKAPDEVRPEQQVSVTVKEKKGKPMTFTLAVVDEGLLDLTGFRTPDPWNHFYARQALGVSTMDLFDNVIGAYGGRIGGVLSIGGDEAGGEGETKQSTQRFKPMVRFFGPYHLSSGSSKKIEFQMPEYIGSVRIMAIGANDGAYGASDVTMMVRSPLMVQATLPRILATNETLSMPVTVFAMSEKVKNVKLSVKVNDVVRVRGTSTNSMSFDKMGDQTISFPIETSFVTGRARVEVTAESGGEVATTTVEIDVRNPNPRITQVAAAQVSSGKSATLTNDAFVEASDVRATVEVGGLPAIPLSRFLSYLNESPHSCSELLTSRAFLQMLYPELVKTSKEEKERLSGQVNQLISRLAQFQLPNGGFSMWPGYSTPDYWVTSYIGHFFLAAKERGYKVSPSVLSKWNRYQRTEANSWSAERARDNSALCQAYRLYTLALAGSPQMGVMNRLREAMSLSAGARWRLAAAYAVAGNQSAADKLVSGASTTPEENYDGYYFSFGSVLRDQAMLLESLVRLKQNDKALTVLQGISARMSSNDWISSQEMGFGALAVAEFAKAVRAGKDDVKGDLTVNGKSEQVSSDAGLYRADATPQSGGKSSVSFKNTSKGTLFVTLTASGIPTEPFTEATANNLSLRVSYLSLSGTAADVRSQNQGSDFVARVEVSNPGLRGDLSNLVLDYALPVGWEVRNTRMEGESNFNSSSSLYQDFRDERVLTYFNLRGGETKVFYFVVNASYAGRFVLPATTCSALYDGRVTASSPGGTVEVVR